MAYRVVRALLKDDGGGMTSVLGIQDLLVAGVQLRAMLLVLLQRPHILESRVDSKKALRAVSIVLDVNRYDMDANDRILCDDYRDRAPALRHQLGRGGVLWPYEGTTAP